MSADEERAKRIASGTDELLRRQMEDKLERALRSADWRTLAGVILDLYMRLLKMDRFAADLIAELEASRERKK